MNMMKTFSSTALAILALFAASLATGAEAKKARPYPLDTCVVSGEKLGADASMKPYAFTHEGHEVKLCCKSCLKDFKKDTAKYMAKIEAAEKKAK